MVHTDYQTKSTKVPNKITNNSQNMSFTIDPSLNPSSNLKRSFFIIKLHTLPLPYFKYLSQNLQDFFCTYHINSANIEPTKHQRLSAQLSSCCVFLLFLMHDDDSMITRIKLCFTVYGWDPSLLLHRQKSLKIMFRDEIQKIFGDKFHHAIV